jgi:hypothetical protein
LQIVGVTPKIPGGDDFPDYNFQLSPFTDPIGSGGFDFDLHSSPFINNGFNNGFERDFDIDFDIDFDFGYRGLRLGGGQSAAFIDRNRYVRSNSRGVSGRSVFTGRGMIPKPMDLIRQLFR